MDYHSNMIMHVSFTFKFQIFFFTKNIIFTVEMPPTILFRHQLGSIAQSPDGKLIVYPGTILHLECLWLRKYGKPIWKWDHQSASYNQGTFNNRKYNTFNWLLIIFQLIKIGQQNLAETINLNTNFQLFIQEKKIQEFTLALLLITINILLKSLSKVFFNNH